MAARKPKTGTAASTNAVDIAMDAAASGTAVDQTARSLLIQQERLIRWQTASEKAGFTLRLLTGAAGLAAALALGWMVWSASQANGVIVESFSVPPALAQRGVTGEVLAAKVMDHLSRMRRVAQSSEPERRVGSGWDTGISVEIPTTGISIGQLDQWLRDKFGHETRVAGELIIGPAGRLALSARSGAVGLLAISGAEAELPVMIERTAEAILKSEQPFVYALYLSRDRATRLDDSLAFARELIASPDRATRALGYHSLGSIMRDTGSSAEARAAFRRAIETDEYSAPGALNNLAILELVQGHPEQSYHLASRYLRILEKGDYYSPEAKHQRRLTGGRSVATLEGDHNLANALYDEFRALTPLGYTDIRVSADAALRTALHDLKGAKARLSQYAPKDGQYHNRAMALADAAEDWPGLLAAAEEASVFQATQPDAGSPQPHVFRALALAKVGRHEEAQAAIDQTGLDCQPCVIVRGKLAETAGKHRLADHWLGQAVKMAPSLPVANYEWGRVLLTRGDAEGALAKAKAANALGPKWGDPLVLWGEALLAQGDERGAVAKFRAADKLATLWGRLHLVWGEALAKQGKAKSATEQWQIAKGLDLTAAERARLTTNLAKGA